MKEELDQLFGSDEAIGVRIRLFNEEGNPLADLAMADFLNQYENSSQAEILDMESIMPDGSSATVCTNYARHIHRCLTPKGHVVVIRGFANEDNPDCRCARESFHPGGHDFAIVNQRYLVDPWVRLVAGVEQQIVYDMQDPTDATKVTLIYGKEENWGFL